MVVDDEVGPLVLPQVEARVHLQDEEVQRENLFPNLELTPKTQNPEEDIQLPTVALRGRLRPRDEVIQAFGEPLRPGLMDTDRAHGLEPCVGR